MSSDTTALRIGARIREEREARGFTQPRLAGLLGVTQQALDLYEKGLRPFPTRLNEALAGHLGVTLDIVACADARPAPGPRHLHLLNDAATRALVETAASLTPDDRWRLVSAARVMASIPAQPRRWFRWFGR